MVAVLLRRAGVLPETGRRVADRRDDDCSPARNGGVSRPTCKVHLPGDRWLDERARSNVTSFSKAIGVETIHRITGRYPDVTPTIYRLDWMRQHEPETFARTACFADCSAISCSDWRAVLFGPVG